MSVVDPIEPHAASQLPRVLVIEDERKMAMVVARALSAAGYDVATATTGLDGLEALRSDPFALVILDLRLPDVDGVALLARATELIPDQPVLILSAVSDVQSKVRCLELGACDYVAKPFELAELVARVRLRTRERWRTHARRRLKSGRYVLDLERRVVDDGASTIHLTTREFVLLEYLMEHEGKTCSRDELLSHVWGYSFDPGTNVVDVCVGRVRHKLGGDCVTTVRNVGYCFVGA
jgi:two-component system OmpR family response regulator